MVILKAKFSSEYKIFIYLAVRKKPKEAPKQLTDKTWNPNKRER